MNNQITMGQLQEILQTNIYKPKPANSREMQYIQENTTK